MNLSEQEFKQTIESLKGFSVLLLKHLSSYKIGGEEENKSLFALANILKDAKSVKELNEIKKRYKDIVFKIDKSIKRKEKNNKSGLLGSLLKGKDSTKDLKLIDNRELFIQGLSELTSIFAKGALLLLDKGHPLNSPLSQLKSKDFNLIKTSELGRIKHDIDKYFFSKSNEAVVIEREKNELKDIIKTLTKQIAKLALSSASFNTKITDYAESISKAAELDQIVEIKKKIIEETRIIQEENKQVLKHASESEERLNHASERIEELEEELKKTRVEMMRDPLTKIFNRGAFDEKIKEQINRYKRYKDPFVLVMFDLDHFKKINDTYGHPGGDVILQAVASITRKNIRVVDFLARYGGEEFVIIAEKIQSNDAFKMAEKIREAVSSHRFICRKKKVPVTISLGVANCTDTDNAHTIIKKADTALYEAKEGGRNQTVMK